MHVVDDQLPQTTFLGERLFDGDTEAVARVLASRDPREPFAYVVTPNAQHIVLLHRHPDGALRKAYDHAWLRLCDSQVLRGLGRSLFGMRLPLAAGSDVTALLFAQVIRPDDPITVIGGDAELGRRLEERFHLKHLSLHAPPMGYIKQPEAVEECVRFVCDHPARFVFIVTGAPQSEILAERIAREPGATGIGLCVGGSLLFITGLRPRAPRSMRRLGLEWLHRLLLDPRGYGKRLFGESLPVVWIALRHAARARRERSNS